jgi:prepilin signal peptidase PulO-like enzyme (type II secretory pathway)
LYFSSCDIFLLGVRYFAIIFDQTVYCLWVKGCILSFFLNQIWKGIVAEWRQKLSYMDSHILLTGVKTVWRSLLFIRCLVWFDSYHQYFRNMVSGIYNVNILFILLIINFN